MNRELTYSMQGYDPFGSLLPGRNYSSNSYRHGFNGMEKDDEMHGATGTSYDFGARIYDARVGRWLSLDPLASKYAAWSAYNGMLDNPIRYRDVDGRDIEDSWMMSGGMYYRGYSLFASTSIARGFMRNFTNGNDSHLFKGMTPGKHANHTLRFRTILPSEVRGGVEGSTRTSLKRNDGSTVALRTVTADDVQNSSMDVLFEILVTEHVGNARHAQTIGHEVFVHANLTLASIEALRADIAKGKISATDYEGIAAKLRDIGQAAGPGGGANDHANIVLGTNKQYKTFQNEVIQVATCEEQPVLEREFQSEVDQYKKDNHVQESIQNGRNTRKK